MAAENLLELREFIHKELGIKMPASKVPMLHGRLQKRLRALGITSLAEYKEHLLHAPKDSDEVTQFIDAVTTNKTDFYRESAHFDFLLDRVVPQHTRATSRRLDIWCAGCSTGEEPYTIAMLLAHHARTRVGFEFGVLATDISTRVLEHARDGIYAAERVEPLPPAVRERYVMRSKDRTRKEVRISPEIRARVKFHRLNFMDADYGVANTFDAIFFRNVAIYFEPSTQEAVVSKLCRNLAVGGYLFIGHSESLSNFSLPLKYVSPAVYQRTP